MENRKTSIIIYPADFLASVHNFKKSEIANFLNFLFLVNFINKCDIFQTAKRLNDLAVALVFF